MPRVFKPYSSIYAWNKSGRGEYHQGKVVNSLRSRPYYVGGSTAQVGSGNLTVASHANSLAGDLFVAQYTVRNGSSPGTPAGWTWLYLADYLTGEWYGQGYAVLTSPAQSFVMGGTGYKTHYGVTFRDMNNEFIGKGNYDMASGKNLPTIPAGALAGDLVIAGGSAAYTGYDYIMPYGEWWISAYNSNGNNTPTTMAWKMLHEDEETMGYWRVGDFWSTPGGNAQTFLSVWR
jgi:hypothetical protein